LTTSPLEFFNPLNSYSSWDAFIVPLYGKRETLTGRAKLKAKVITASSTIVLGPLFLGIRPNLSKRNMPIPGIVNVGNDNKSLLNAVYTTALFAATFEMPISSPNSS